MSQQRARSGVIGIARRRISSAQSTDAGPLVTQPCSHTSGYTLLDAHAFRNAMNVLIARERHVFTILVIRPEQLGSTLALGETILRQSRGTWGDLVGYLEGAVGVALRRTDHVGAVSFADRARDDWRRAGNGELLVDIAEHPFAEQRVIELLTADWSAASWMPAVIEESDRPRSQRRRADVLATRAGIAERQ
jgi:hypothetical protein